MEAWFSINNESMLSFLLLTKLGENSINESLLVCTLLMIGTQASTLLMAGNSYNQSQATSDDCYDMTLTKRVGRNL